MDYMAVANTTETNKIIFAMKKLVLFITAIIATSCFAFSQTTATDFVLVQHGQHSPGVNLGQAKYQWVPQWRCPTRLPEP